MSFFSDVKKPKFGSAKKAESFDFNESWTPIDFEQSFDFDFEKQSLDPTSSETSRTIEKEKTKSSIEELSPAMPANEERISSQTQQQTAISQLIANSNTSKSHRQRDSVPLKLLPSISRASRDKPRLSKDILSTRFQESSSSANDTGRTEKASVLNTFDEVTQRQSLEDTTKETQKLENIPRQQPLAKDLRPDPVPDCADCGLALDEEIRSISTSLRALEGPSSELGAQLDDLHKEVTDHLNNLLLCDPIATLGVEVVAYFRKLHRLRDIIGDMKPRDSTTN